jgi:hypothetical protein
MANKGVPLGPKPVIPPNAPTWTGNPDPNPNPHPQPSRSDPPPDRRKGG